MTWRRLLENALLGLAVLGVGCSVYNESLLQDGTGGGGSGAAGGGGPECSFGKCWWSGEQGSGCFSVGTPTESSRPNPGDVDQTELEPIYLGLESMRLGTTNLEGVVDPDAWQTFGLDLDGVCTNSSTCEELTDAVSCKSVSPQLPFDGIDCRDNTFARLQPVAAQVPEIGQTFGLSEEVINCGIHNGAYNIIARVSGYNGTENDDNVRIDFYASNGTEADPGWECPLDNFLGQYPRWRVSTPWRIAEDDLVAPGGLPGEIPNSKYADPAAYVRDGYFVARLPDGAPLNLPGDNFAFPGFNLKLQKGLWTGRVLRAQDGTWRVEDGLSSGRVTKDDLVGAFREIGFCEDQGVFYDTLISYVDENADVLADGRTDPTRECDAMSVGIAFVAAQLTPGSVVKLAAPPGCPMN